MAGWTNLGKKLALGIAFQAATPPTNFYVALITATTAPTVDMDTFSQVSEIGAGNGYTSGGYQLTRNTTDFDVLTEVDASDWSFVQIKDLKWTASGGNIPASGTGARYAVLLGGNTSGSEMWGYWDLSSARTVSDGQTLTLQNCELRGAES